MAARASTRVALGPQTVNGLAGWSITMRSVLTRMVVWMATRLDRALIAVPDIDDYTCGPGPAMR